MASKQGKGGGALVGVCFFSTLPLKLKLGLQMCGRLLIAIHLDQSTICVLLCCAFSCLSKPCKNARPKPLCWDKLACLDFSSSNFHLQSHILSTTEVALVNWKFTESAHHPCMCVNMCDECLCDWIVSLAYVVKRFNHWFLATKRWMGMITWVLFCFWLNGRSVCKHLYAQKPQIFKYMAILCTSLQVGSF
jgi:hypothetical protein